MTAATYDILVVDDEEEHFVVTRNLFARTGSRRFRVRWASRYEDGLAAALGGEPDLCLVDHDLGGVSGLELASEARERGVTTPMILLLSEDSDRLSRRAREAGFDDAMAKSNLTAELLERAVRYTVERRAAQAALTESEAKFRMLFDANPFPNWVIDAATNRFIAVNQAAIEQYGYSREEFLALRLLDIQADQSAAIIESRSLVAAAVAELVPLQHMRKDGSLIDVDISFQEITFEGRIALLAVARNITESLAAVAALRQSEVHLRELAANINTVFFVVDPLTRQAVYLSAAYERIFEQTPEEGLARPDAWLGRIHPGDMDRVLGRGATVSNELEFRIVRRDGTIRWIRACWTILPDAAGKRRRAIGTAEDITDLRRAQQQAETNSRMEAVGRLAGGVAHDFNNILTAILGESDYLLSSLAPDDSRRSSAEEIIQSSMRAADLTRQLLAFGRQQMFTLRTLNLSALVLGMDKLLRRTIGEDVELWTATQDDLGAVRADAGQIEQIVMNLVVNARDAMPDGGRLTIETANADVGPAMAARYHGLNPGPYVVLAVSDVGLGMTDEVKARVFEPFFTTKGPGHGTGLGLATVYGIVKQSGGYVDIESQPGAGTTVRVYLPRVQGPVEAPAERISDETVAGGSETILVIEDEQAVRHIAERVLTRQGYRVLLAESGYDAIQVAGSHAGPIDAVLTDVVMPKISGPDAVRIIREMRPDVRVLFMSGYTNRALVDELRATVGSTFLQKPFTPATLLKTLRRELDAARVE